MTYKVRKHLSLKDFAMVFGSLAIVIVSLFFTFFFVGKDLSVIINLILTAILVAIFIIIPYKNRRKIKIIENNIVVIDKKSTPLNIPKEKIKYIEILKYYRGFGGVRYSNLVSLMFVDSSKYEFVLHRADRKNFIKEVKEKFGSDFKIKEIGLFKKSEYL